MASTPLQLKPLGQSCVSILVSTCRKDHVLLGRAGGVAARDYTPADALQLFQDAGLRQAQALGPLLLGNASANSTPPGTHFYGFIGTGGLPCLQRSHECSWSHADSWPETGRAGCGCRQSSLMPVFYFHGAC